MKITTYLEAREYLESLIKPIPYKNQAVDQSSYNPLDRMRKLLELLGNPEKKFLSVQVSGTSGKGSTAYLISHILTSAGYKTGLTISPHLQSLTERFQINEQQITPDTLISLVTELPTIVEQMRKLEVGEPTYFEVLMGLTFLYFAREGVDIAVVEVGLEGRYDGTNTLDPLVFILTNISLDHVELLGDSVQKIAIEAMGAVERKGRNHEGNRVPIVITGATDERLVPIIESVCTEENLSLHMLNKQFHCEVQAVTETGVQFNYQSNESTLRDLFVSLVGEYQAVNATLALETVRALQQFGFTVSGDTIRESLRTAYFAGRFEITQYPTADKTHTLILDGAHNPAKMNAFVASLRKLYPNHRCIVILGCKQHKDITSIIQELLPITDTAIATRYYTTTEAAKNSSMTVQDVVRQLKIATPLLTIYEAETVGEAIQTGISVSEKSNELIVITGSLYLVGEAKAYLSEQE